MIYNKILISNTNTNIGYNNYINKDHKNSVTLTKPGGAEGAALKMNKPKKEIDNQKMLTKKHTNEKLAITLLVVRAGQIAYHYW